MRFIKYISGCVSSSVTSYRNPKRTVSEYRAVSYRQGTDNDQLHLFPNQSSSVRRQFRVVIDTWKVCRNCRDTFLNNPSVLVSGGCLKSEKIYDDEYIGIPVLALSQSCFDRYFHWCHHSRLLNGEVKKILPARIMMDIYANSTATYENDVFYCEFHLLCSWVSYFQSHSPPFFFIVRGNICQKPADSHGLPRVRFSRIIMMHGLQS